MKLEKKILDLELFLEIEYLFEYYSLKGTFINLKYAPYYTVCPRSLIYIYIASMDKTSWAHSNDL